MINATESVRRNQINPANTYKGYVIANDDTQAKDGLQMGRIKCKIAGVMDFGDDVSLYPWCIPHWAHGDGSTDYTGTFDVPKLNAQVGIKFQPTPTGDGSLLHPVYGPFHIMEGVVLEDAKWHYPNRKVHRLSNGFVLIEDTEDDSMWLYNPGELFQKSRGKSVYKAEQTLVILSDVEVGVRAPEICLRAKDHLIMESEDKITMRCKGRMNIESRDDIWLLARVNVDFTAAQGQFVIQARCDDPTGDNQLPSLNDLGKSGKGDIIIHSNKDNIWLVADGEQAGRQADVSVISQKNNVNVLANGIQTGEQADVNVTSMKNNVTVKTGVTPKGEKANITLWAMNDKNAESSVVMYSDWWNIDVQTSIKNTDQPRYLNFINHWGNTTVHADGHPTATLDLHSVLLTNVLSDTTVVIAAPSVSISVG